MQNQFSRDQYKNSLSIAAICGVISSLIFTVLAAIIVTSLINKGVIQESSMRVYSVVIWVISGFVCSLLAIVIHKNKYLITAAIALLIYLVILFGISILIFEGKFINVWQGIIGPLIGSIIAVAVSRRKNISKKRKFKYQK